MFTWLNENEGAVVGLATIALVLVTIVYVWLTHRLVNQSRTAQVGAELAILEITYEGEVGLGEQEGLRHAFSAHVVNVGNGPAVQLGAKLRLGDLRMLCSPL